MGNSKEKEKLFIERLDLEKKYVNPDFIDFSWNFKIESDSKYIMESYWEKTYIEKKWEDLFVIWDIEWTEKEIKEIADFINKAKIVAKRLPKYEKVFVFLRDEDTWLPQAALKRIDIPWIDSEGGYVEIEYPEVVRYVERTPIFSKTIRKGLPEDNVIKQNIDKILDYLNKNK